MLTKPREVTCDHRPASLLVLPFVFVWRGYFHCLPDLLLEGQKAHKTEVVEGLMWAKFLSFWSDVLAWHAAVGSGWNVSTVCLCLSQAKCHFSKVHILGTHECFFDKREDNTSLWNFRTVIERILKHFICQVLDINVVKMICYP